MAGALPGTANHEPTSAQVRAAIPRGLLQTVEHPMQAERVRRRLTGASRAQLEGAGRSDWLSAEVLLDVYESIADISGELGLQSCVRKFACDAIGLAIFGGIVSSALRILGPSPGTLFRLIPLGLAASLRHAGEVQVQEARFGSEIVVHWTGLEPRLRVPAWVSASLGAYRGLLDLSGVTGEVCFGAGDCSQGELRFEVRWDVKSAAVGGG